MGASLMEQTGWNIIILVGGPSPEHDGMIMSFSYIRQTKNYKGYKTHRMCRSHMGKTTSGKRFKKFLEKQEYGVSLLLPFKRFLHSSFCEYND